MRRRGFLAALFAVPAAIFGLVRARTAKSKLQEYLDHVMPVQRRLNELESARIDALYYSGRQWHNWIRVNSSYAVCGACGLEVEDGVSVAESHEEAERILFSCPGGRA